MKMPTDFIIKAEDSRRQIKMWFVVDLNYFYPTA